MVGNSKAEEFLNVFHDQFLKQAILEPRMRNNILDLILTNIGKVVTQVKVGGQLGNSDHCERQGESF